MVASAACWQITRLGEFENEEDAAREYDKAVRRIVGSMGECNFDAQVRCPDMKLGSPGSAG